MTKKDKRILAGFITRTGMYIQPNDQNNIISFIQGYEIGKSSKYEFTESLKKLLIEKYKIKYDAYGWPGQIRRLSEKQSLSWIVTFKKIALEILLEPDTVDKEMSKIIRTKLTGLLHWINPSGDSYFNETWKDEWLALVSVKSKWFKHLWTDKEYKIILLIDKEILSNRMFENKKHKIPTSLLVKYKNEFTLLY
ncbi:MAG: hypothetical protein WAQ28_12130 [Bacteroidia bacterium]